MRTGTTHLPVGWVVGWKNPYVALCGFRAMVITDSGLIVITVPDDRDQDSGVMVITLWRSLEQ